MSTDTEWSWVKAVSSCSVAQKFSELKLDLERDVEDRNDLVRPGEPTFTIASNGSKVGVSKAYGKTLSTVIFSMIDKGISVRDDDGLIFEDMLTINDQRECRFKIGEQELEPWQMRKRALWKLFFESA